MTHYVCKGGCNGVSENPGTCQTAGCAGQNQAMEACECPAPESHAGGGAAAPDMSGGEAASTPENTENPS